jgi:hypothetical protein
MRPTAAFAAPDQVERPLKPPCWGLSQRGYGSKGAAPESAGRPPLRRPAGQGRQLLIEFGLRHNPPAAILRGMTKLPEHDFQTGGMDGWVDRVFLAADHFRLHRFHGKGGHDHLETQSFAEAMLAADRALKLEYRVLVYAVTKTGRSACLPRALWGHFAELYRPTDASGMRRQLSPAADIASDRPR